MGRKMKSKNGLISAAMNTPQGRTALAAAMTAPVKTSVMYQNIGRKILMVDELPDVEQYKRAKDDVSKYMREWMKK